jgi:multidrug efflux pump subunit AcrA (membrane-fusion protein)
LGKLEAMRDLNRAKLRDANLMIERSEVIAPFDGVINTVAVSVGDRVDTGQTLVSLYPSDSLEVRAHIPARYVAQVQQTLANGEAQRAKLVTSAGSLWLTLKRLAGEAAPSGIDAYFDAGEASSDLRPGALLTLNFTLPRQDDVIAVPYRAIYGNSRLYLLRENRLQGIDVETEGQFRNKAGDIFMLVRSDQINQGDTIVVTHLPNAVSGLKVRSSGDEASR